MVSPEPAFWNLDHAELVRKTGNDAQLRAIFAQPCHPRSPCAHSVSTLAATPHRSKRGNPKETEKRMLAYPQSHRALSAKP